MQAGVVGTRVRATLLDSGGVYWPDAELYDYLSAAQTAVVNLKPDAYAQTVFVSLVPGVLQSIPSDGSQLLDVVRNADGTAIRQIDRNALSHANQSWASGGQTEVLHFMPDPRNPLRFHVFPPSDGTSSVEVVYAGTPPRVTQAGDSLALADVYESALHAYVCALAFAKNTDRGDLAKYQGFMGQFYQLVSGKSQAQVAEAPPGAG